MNFLEGIKSNFESSPAVDVAPMLQAELVSYYEGKIADLEHKKSIESYGEDKAVTAAEKAVEIAQKIYNSKFTTLSKVDKEDYNIEGVHVLAAEIAQRVSVAKKALVAAEAKLSQAEAVKEAKAEAIDTAIAELKEALVFVSE